MIERGSSDASSVNGRRRPSLTVDAGALILVCLSFLVLQWMLFPHDRPPGWDESVYLSQITPGAEAAFFAGWRARGITVIVAPTVSTADAKARFGEDAVDEVKPYLRYTTAPA